MNASELLTEAAAVLADRGRERDTEQGERSMATTVAMFNLLAGTQLTEVQGWQFMQLLKLVRSSQGAYRADDYLDGIGYAALAAEAAAGEPGNEAWRVITSMAEATEAAKRDGYPYFAIGPDNVVYGFMDAPKLQEDEKHWTLNGFGVLGQFLDYRGNWLTSHMRVLP